MTIPELAAEVLTLRGALSAIAAGADANGYASAQLAASRRSIPALTGAAPVRYANDRAEASQLLTDPSAALLREIAQLCHALAAVADDCRPAERAAAELAASRRRCSGTLQAFGGDPVQEKRRRERWRARKQRLQAKLRERPYEVTA